MSTSLARGQDVPWWKEPTKDQWLAWWAAWLGWTLDAFDFTVFLLIMVPIAKEFNVPLTAVTAVFAITLWLRLVGATASGWLADRVGRKISADDLDPVVLDLQLHRRLLSHLCLPVLLPRAARHRHGRGMAGRRLTGDGILAGALARAHESVSARLLGAGLPRSRPWPTACCIDIIGWRGLLWIGILPALVVVWVRKYVKEPEVWLENRKKQREQNQQVRLPLFVIFKRGNLANTLTACWWMASAFTVYYSIFALFATHLQKDLALSAALVAVPLMFSNAATFVSSFLWGWVADAFGRRWSMIIPAIIALAVTPTYLFTNDYLTLASASRCRACSAARSTARIQAICPSVSRPRCGRPLPASATTRARSSVAWSHRC